MFGMYTSDVHVITADCEFTSCNDIVKMMATFEGCEENLLTDWKFKLRVCEYP